MTYIPVSQRAQKTQSGYSPITNQKKSGYIPVAERVKIEKTQVKPITQIKPTMTNTEILNLGYGPIRPEVAEQVKSQLPLETISTDKTTAFSGP
jgi:hypothetical protein